MTLKRILITALAAAATGGLLGVGVLAASANQTTPSSAPTTVTSNANPQQVGAPGGSENVEKATETEAESATDPAGDPAGGLESQHDFQGQETGEH